VGPPSATVRYEPFEHVDRKIGAETEVDCLVAIGAAALQTSLGPCPCGRPHLRPASVQGRREEVSSLPARHGGRVSVHAIQLRAPLLRIPAVRQFQVGLRPTGLLVRLVLREATAAVEVLRSARRAIAAELDRRAWTSKP
jgi:phenylacetate-coenzyme A ligase PaaK-like adenylate-forming protein